MLSSFGRIVLLAYYTAAINEQRESYFFEKQFTTWREGEERWAEAESPAELWFLICSGLTTAPATPGRCTVARRCTLPSSTDRQTDRQIDRQTGRQQAVRQVHSATVSCARCLHMTSHPQVRM